MSATKIISLILISLILFSAGFYLAKKIYFPDEKTPATTAQSYSGTSETSITKQARVEPLSAEQRALVLEIIETSDFAKEIPADDPISLRFFYFENGERIWQDYFLIAEGKTISDGKATIDLTLHSKYLEEINTLGLCDTIKKANENRDLGFETEYGTASLLWKYSSLMKYKDCLGM
jgi:hypothetical protein